MKRLATNSISASTEMPLKAGTLEFLQDAYKEGLAGILSNVVGSPQTGVVYILSGCVNSTIAPIHTISAGVLYYDGEIYQSDAATFTLTGSDKAFAGIDVTQFVVNADPVEFTDGVFRNVHNIRKIAIAPALTGTGLPEFKDFVPVVKFFKGETKNIVMDSVEYAAKFVQSGGTEGLGLLEYTGWAVMNGNNGTQDDDGLVEVAYGTTYNVLGDTGGEIEHTLTVPETPALTSTSAVVVSTTGGGTVALTAGTQQQIALAKGGDMPHNNMQPYVVRLRIQKI